MPSALKVQELYGDAIQVIFVECQGSNRDQYEAFAWKTKWIGGRAMWTEERPFQTLSNGLPETALIGVDGKILMQGNPGDFGSKLEEAIAAEVKKSKDAPEGTPAAVKKAWTTFLKGDVAAALAECDKLANDDAKAARAEFVTRTQRRVARAKWLVDNGYAAEAEDLLGKLAKGVKGAPELETAVAAQSARLDEPAFKAEREASNAYAAFVAQVSKKKPFEAANVKKAESAAENYKGTKSAERFTRFAELSKVKPSEG